MHTETLAPSGSSFFNSLQHQVPDGLPPTISSARAAAEAAFESVAAPLEAVDAEPQVVVIKRKKAIAPASDPVDLDAGSPEQAEQVRGGRVFRLETPVAGSDTPVVEETPASAESDLPNLAPVAAQKPRRKRRRPSAHGPVTVTRLVSDEPTEVDAPRESRTRNKVASSTPVTKKPRASRSVEDTSATMLRAHLAAAKRYQAIVSDVARLREKAEAVRKVEAADAVQWIRQTVATYGLAPRDLGF